MALASAGGASVAVSRCLQPWLFRPRRHCCRQPGACFVLCSWSWHCVFGLLWSQACRAAHFVAECDPAVAAAASAGRGAAHAWCELGEGACWTKLVGAQATRCAREMSQNCAPDCGLASASRQMSLRSWCHRSTQDGGAQGQRHVKSVQAVPWEVCDDDLRVSLQVPGCGLWKACRGGVEGCLRKLVLDVPPEVVLGCQWKVEQAHWRREHQHCSLPMSGLGQSPA